ncbi:MAG: vitamin K epoxide reductase family protein [Mycobacteriales bacterium]
MNAAAVRAASLVLAVLGLGLSVYLTIEHYSSGTTLACPATSTVNCAKVTTSPESKILGIPVAVLGLLFFIAMVGLTLPVSWRARNAIVHQVRVASASAGIVFVLWLIYAELFRINAICLWCTGVHIVTFLLFCVVAYAAAYWGFGPADEPAQS